MLASFCLNIQQAEQFILCERKSKQGYFHRNSSYVEFSQQSLRIDVCKEKNGIILLQIFLYQFYQINLEIPFIKTKVALC